MIIDGKQIYQKVLVGLKEKIREKNLKLRLAAILVSSNQGIKKFVELKSKAAREIGVDYNIYEFPETIAENQLKEEVRKIVQDNANDGVLVELPLPKEINTQNVLNEITLEKDVDVLSQEAQDRFFSDKNLYNKNCNCNFCCTAVSVVLPPAVEAVRTVFEFYNFDVRGKKAAVFGSGLLVGKPVTYWLSQNGVDVSVIDEHTENPRRYSIEADIVISGAGKPELIGGDMVKDGVVAIDFGYSSRTKSRGLVPNEAGRGTSPRLRTGLAARLYFVRDANKEDRMVGDFKFAEIAPRASLITPVPGGIGPVVVAAVLKNLVKLNS